jgi:hypothetical protein
MLFIYVYMYSYIHKIINIESNPFLLIHEVLHNLTGFNGCSLTANFEILWHCWFLLGNLFVERMIYLKFFVPWRFKAELLCVGSSFVTRLFLIKQFAG